MNDRITALLTELADLRGDVLHCYEEHPNRNNFNVVMYHTRQLVANLPKNPCTVTSAMVELECQIRDMVGCPVVASQMMQTSHDLMVAILKEIRK